MEEASQDADYFVQLNELFVNFKLVMKQFKPSESVDYADTEVDDPDKENVDRAETAQAAKNLTDAILGCLDAKLEGMTPIDIHYYRLLGMKSSILVERSKIYAAIDEDEESFRILDEALALITGAVPRAETSYVALRLVNHYAYVLSVEEHFDKAKTVLLEGERIYTLLGEDAVHAGFLAGDDLFMPECSVPVGRSETAGYLERLATNNMQMLGFVYGRLGDWVRFASCGHLALRRQLEGREGEALAWAARAARLAQNFLTRSRYREARTHLAAATHVLQLYEADLRDVEPDEQVNQKMAEVEMRAGDIGRAWTKYALHLLDASSRDDEDGSTASSESSSDEEEGGYDDARGDADADGDDGKLWDKLVTEERKKGKRDRKRLTEQLSQEDLQEQGDVVIEAVKEQDDAVEVSVDEEGDHKPLDAQAKVEDVQVIVEEIDDADNETDKEVEKAEDSAGTVEIVETTTPEDKPPAGEEVAEPEVTEPEVTEAGVSEPEITALEEGVSPYKDCCGLHDVDGEDDDTDEEDADDSEDYTFPTLDLDYIYNAVPCDPVDSAEKARALMQFVSSWSERVMRVYDVAGHPEQHAAAAMDHAELLRYLASYAPLDAAYALHRTRSHILEQMCDALKEVNPKVYEVTSIDIYRELADIQLEMMTLNLRRLDVANHDS